MFIIMTFSQIQYCLLILVLLLVFHFNVNSSCHCHPEESSALLKFKTFLNTSLDVDDPLPSWNQTTNCCLWEGVTCDKVTSHVIGLDLSFYSLSASLSSNPTLFLSLPKPLQRLNLAFNDFGRSNIPSSLFTHLVSLTHLNLSNCFFTGSVPPEISLLTNLVSLDLSGNNHRLMFDNRSFLMLARNSSKLSNVFLDLVNLSSVPPSSLLNFTSLRRLSLGGCGLQGEFPREVFHFPNLQYLDLSENYGITGYLPESNWSIPIEVLDLSYCNFRGPLPTSLGNLTQIISLGLSSNNFRGEIPNVFGSLRRLAGHLSLGSANFIGQLPLTIFNLTQITHLDLSENSLEGMLPTIDQVSGLRNLKLLDLSFNLISGGVPTWLFTLPSLQVLHLSHSKLSGVIMSPNWPSSLPSSLRHIDLSNNKLTGPIPSFFFDIVNLTRLILSSNNFSSVITSEMLSKPNKLRLLDVSNNSLLSTSTSSDGNDYTSPNLETLSFSCCNVRRFPYFLRTAKRLRDLDLSRNKIRGSISKWESEGWESLATLNLSYNLLTRFSLEQFPGRNLEDLDLRSNQLQGPFLVPPPSLYTFSVSENKLTGEIPTLICNLRLLISLDLSRNNLSGVIPPCLVHSSSYLTSIKLQMNNFHGQIPAFESKQLENLVLNDNRLEGLVPRSLVNCTSLVYLNLANNCLNDTFPHWLGMLPELRYLILGSNRLHGHLNNSIFSKLRVIDVSQNEFTGLLPKEFFRNLSAYKVVSLDSPPREVCFKHVFCWRSDLDNSVKVTMKRLQIEIEEGSILPSFTLIDFSNNQFHGGIPDVVGELVGLHVLNLSHNYLTGPIPPTLGNMQALESLDLSSNKLWGRIPPELTNLNFLEVFNLSQNNLQGPISVGKQFNTFDNDSYGGNPRLCGDPLSKKCDENMPEPPPPSSSAAADDEDDSGIPFIWKTVMMGYGCGVVLGLSMGYIVFTTGRPWWIVRKVERDWQNNVTKWIRIIIRRN